MGLSCSNAGPAHLEWLVTLDWDISIGSWNVLSHLEAGMYPRAAAVYGSQLQDYDMGGRPERAIYVV